MEFGIALSVFLNVRIGLVLTLNKIRPDWPERKGGFIIKIASSTVGMESERQYAEFRMDTYSSTSWGKSGTVSSFAELAMSMSEADVSDGNSETTEKSKSDPQGSTQDNMQNTADAIRSRYEAMKARLAQNDRNADSMYLELKAKCVNFLIELLFGIKTEDDDEGTSYASVADAAGITNEGGSYTEYHYSSETETTSFETTGTAVTEDGRQLEFGLSVTMSRQFVQESGVQIDYGTPQYCDPLVVNLSGNPDSISDQTFSFDIDSDGVEDQISRLTEGSGFLALDKNGDGVINDGGELFGTESGNGFEDLAQYDEDRNGWIDENDSVFSRLKIWTKDSSGNDALVDLKKSDIGAICLKSAATKFAVNKVTDNDPLAQLRRSGFFLHEGSGTAGTVRQFDMVKQAYA